MIFFISDIHLGVKLPFKDFNDSLDEIFNIIKNHEEECKAIMICGDLFDHNLNIEESIDATHFIIKLVLNGCGRNGVKHVPVHIIDGTFSHDRKQMKIFMPILEKLTDASVFYVDHVTSAILSDGTKVLYLPQEYGNIDYSEYFNKKYDLIVGHGPMSSKTKNVVDSHGNEIMHSVDQLGKISKLCVFGHYHEYTDFGNGVYYTGSMLRFRYNEDTAKVFFMCDDNYNVTTIKNPFVKEFKTINISDPEQLRDNLANDINTPHRFVIHINDNSDMQTYNAIMNNNKLNQNIKFKIITDEKTADELDKILDKSLNDNNDSSTSTVVEPIDSLIYYILDNYKVDTRDQIKEYEKIINKE